MALTIRPLNSGYIPTKPLEYWYHFSCKKYVERLGISNELDQLPDFTFLAAAIAFGSFSGFERLMVISSFPYSLSTVHFWSFFTL